MLAKKQNFIRWRDGESSSLLLLDGHSLRTGPDNSSRFWASYSIFELLEFFESRAEWLVLTYFAELMDSMVHDIATHEAVANLIWQLLDKRPEVMNSGYAVTVELDQALNDTEQWKESSAKAAFNVLGNLLNHVPKSVILLDRIDRFGCHPSGIVESLLDIVNRCGSKVKIFATFGEQLGKKLDIEHGEAEPTLMRMTLNQLMKRPDPMIDA